MCYGCRQKYPKPCKTPTISVCGTRNGGSFSAQVQLYPKPSIPMLIITSTSPVFSLVAPSSHRIYSSRHTTSTYPQLFCLNTCLVHHSNTLKLDDSRICLFVCLFVCLETIVLFLVAGSSVPVLQCSSTPVQCSSAPVQCSSPVNSYTPPQTPSRHMPYRGVFRGYKLLCSL